MISPPTDPLALAVVSEPRVTPNSCAISYLYWFNICSTPGTNNLLLLAIVDSSFFYRVFFIGPVPIEWGGEPFIIRHCLWQNFFFFLWDIIGIYIAAGITGYSNKNGMRDSLHNRISGFILGMEHSMCSRFVHEVKYLY